MSESGTVLAIYIASKAEELPRAMERVRAVPGRGLDGDRYAAGIGTFSNHKGQRDVSLIESEAIEAFERESGTSLSAAESRRNVLTRGVRLNDLVGKEFQVGNVRMRGTSLVRTVHASGAINQATRHFARTRSSRRLVCGDSQRRRIRRWRLD